LPISETPAAVTEFIKQQPSPTASSRSSSSTITAFSSETQIKRKSGFFDDFKSQFNDDLKDKRYSKMGPVQTAISKKKSISESDQNNKKSLSISSIHSQDFTNVQKQVDLLANQSKMYKTDSVSSFNNNNNNKSCNNSKFDLSVSTGDIYSKNLNTENRDKERNRKSSTSINSFQSEKSCY
jgi:hypothetical protein